MKKKKLTFPVVIEKDSDGFYFAKVLTIRGCHTQAKTLPQLYKRLNEVINLCLEAKETEKDLISNNQFVAFQQVEVY